MKTIVYVFMFWTVMFADYTDADADNFLGFFIFWALIRSAIELLRVGGYLALRVFLWLLAHN